MSSDKRKRSAAADIKIEDPLDFLTVAEREAYARPRQRQQESYDRETAYYRQAPARAAAAEAPAGGDRALSLAVKIGAVIIALLLTYIVWLLFLRPVVYGVFGWNSWENVQEQAATQQTFVETTTQLNLRSAPSTESGEIVVAVPAGTRLEQISEADGWTTVLYEGQTLYCSSDYLKAAE